jgi:hypothetical protein
MGRVRQLTRCFFPIDFANVRLGTFRHQGSVIMKMIARVICTPPITRYPVRQPSFVVANAAVKIKGPPVAPAPQQACSQLMCRPS